MQFLLLLAWVALLSGCAWVNQPPRAVDARQMEKGAAETERDRAIAARAKDYERQGLDRRESRAAAEVEYSKSGRRQ